MIELYILSNQSMQRSNFSKLRKARSETTKSKSRFKTLLGIVATALLVLSDVVRESITTSITHLPHNYIITYNLSFLLLLDFSRSRKKQHPGYVWICINITFGFFWVCLQLQIVFGVGKGLACILGFGPDLIGTFTTLRRLDAIAFPKNKKRTYYQTY